jgi:hypothetical protein
VTAVARRQVCSGAPSQLPKEEEEEEGAYMEKSKKVLFLFFFLYSICVLHGTIQGETCYPSIYRLQKQQQRRRNTLEQQQQQKNKKEDDVAMATLGFTQHTSGDLP